MFTFDYDQSTCPHCGSDFTAPSSVVTNGGVTALIDEFGVIAQESDVQLCLDDPATIFFCAKCREQLCVSSFEEI